MATFTAKDENGNDYEVIDIKVAGETLRVPVKATQEPALMKKIIGHFMTTPEFDKILDKMTGSPMRVRTMVGGAPMKDKLKSPVRLFPGCPYDNC